MPPGWRFELLCHRGVACTGYLGSRALVLYLAVRSLFFGKLNISFKGYFGRAPRVGHLPCTGHQAPARCHLYHLTGSRVTNAPGCFAWLPQATAAQLLDMCPARTFSPATSHCSGLHSQSWLLPYLFITLLFQDFAVHAGGKKNTPKLLVVGACK